MKDLVRDIKATARTRSRQVSEQMPEGFFNTGSVLLNLACSDKAFGGFGIGKMVNLIGDSSSGKTLMALSMFAEMARDNRFDDYKFIYDDVEAALEFNLEKLFGQKTAQRITAPKIVGGEGISSSAIQDFQASSFRQLEENKPFLWVLDSLDALTADEEMSRLERDVSDREKGKEVRGSYKMEKAKVIGEILRQVVRKIRDSKSGLVIISQTRDNIDPMSFEKKTRSGGKALKFYACHEVWLAVKSKIRSKERIIGVEIKAKVSKNKVTGKLREVEFPIYYSYGIDNISSCIDFLIKEEKWQVRKNTVIAQGLGIEGTQQKLIQMIEEKGLENKLYLETEKAWLDIEKDVEPKRKPKYV